MPFDNREKVIMNIKIKIAAVSFLFLVLTAACNLKTFAQNNSEILIVADQKAGCRGIVAEDCLQIKHLNEETFTLFRGRIENFNYRSGYFYVLEVRKIYRQNNPDDYQYRLKQMLAREKSPQSAEIPPVVSVKLFAQQWKLTKMDGSPINGRGAFIKFNETEQTAGGNGGCNGFGGTLTINGAQIKISEIISTQMFCQTASPLENKFFKKLESINKFTISNGKLQLWTGSAVSLEFEAMPAGALK